MKICCHKCGVFFGRICLLKREIVKHDKCHVKIMTNIF
jgi:hypothetical protein